MSFRPPACRSWLLPECQTATCLQEASQTLAHNNIRQHGKLTTTESKNAQQLNFFKGPWIPKFTCIFYPFS